MEDVITPVGQTNFRNQKVRFGVKPDDRRRHVYVVGKTGMGKTELLKNMIISDIRAGRGVAFVDPHGDTAEDLLSFIPEERVDDAVYFNPADIAFPISFNPLEAVAAEHRHLVASSVMGVFKKIWPDVWSPRMEYILNNALLALLEYPGSTLLGIMRLLSDKNYREKIVGNLADPVVKNFWTMEFARYTQRFEVEATAAIQNKIGQFVTNPLIRNILGQTHSAVNLRKIMDEKKILIANLSKGRIGEDNSALLGAMLITKLQLAAMSRVDTPEEKRKDFYLFVDEFQNFVTDSFANILSEARKYRLNLTLAHQYINQLVQDGNTKVRDAIFGNVGTMVCFRVGADDAEFLEREFVPDFAAVDLVNLAKFNVYVRLIIDGVASKPFSADTLPPFPRPAESHADLIVENSRRRFALPRTAIEEKIAAEWGEGAVGAEDKVARREERPLGEVLAPREAAPRPPRPKKEIDVGELKKAIEEAQKRDSNQ